MSKKALLETISENRFKVKTIRIDIEGFNYDTLDDNQKSALIHLLELGTIEGKENNFKLLPDLRE